MKKYNKIMNVFTVAVGALEALEAKNTTKAAKLETKKSIVLAEAEAKASTLRDTAQELYDEGAAAIKTIKKLRDLLS